MSLLTLIFTLLLEQLQPLSARKHLSGWLTHYSLFFQQHFNAGKKNQGIIAWLLAVLPVLIAVIVVYWLVSQIHPLLELLFNVLVLYLTMGFRQFSHYFTDIHRALRNADLDQARTLLSQWRGIPSHDLNDEEVARLTIEEALRASQRHVFGVIVWFVLFGALGLGGAAGALLYRMGQILCQSWDEHEELENKSFAHFARQAFYVLEWLPIRLTAMSFAITGDFENTIHCWRTQASSWPDPEAGILLASGAGALGVRLGMPIPQDGLLLDRPELGLDKFADPDVMQSAVGLVWRSVVLWMLLLVMLTLSNLLA